MKSEIPDPLKAYGFDAWFLDLAAPQEQSGYAIARVTAVHKDSYMVTNGEKEILSELLGKLMFSADSPLDFPTVGDWVQANYYDDNSFGIIHDIFPRKSLLKRKTSGKKIDFQLIAANIDTAFIIQSLDGNYNLRRLERYLSMVRESGIQPVVLLSKSDLASDQEIKAKISEIGEAMGSIPVYPFSNKTGYGMDRITDLLTWGKTYCLLGSSGVGKTTLLNGLIGESVFNTKAVREKDGKGRHATTRRQLIRLPSGAMVIDTPGMRELGLFSADTGIDEAFSEIGTLSKQCRFSDCRHISEDGCAVLQAIENGSLSKDRYENYMKMTRESDFLEMSYLEKRNKDKQFGKMVKAVMKTKKNRR